MERSKVMTFSAPLDDYYHSLFIKSPAESYNFTAYTQPLQWLVWITLLIFIALAPPFLYFTTRYPKKDPVAYHEFTLGKSYVYITSALTMRGWGNSPVKPGAQIAFLSLLFFGTITYYNWEAMLISYLSTRVTVLPFKNIPELIALSQHRIIFTPGSYYETMFKTAMDPDWKIAWEDRVKPHLEANIGLNTAKFIALLENDPDSALYDNFFSVQ